VPPWRRLESLNGACRQTNARGSGDSLSERAPISTIVVTHNSEKVISACLSSLEASSFPTNIVLVDNGSEDATMEIVKRDFPDVVATQVLNVGFAGGCNEGVRLAGNEAEAYFFLNPDATVEESCLEVLFDSLLKNDKLAVVSPTVQHPQLDYVEYTGARLDFDRLDFEVLNSLDIRDGLHGEVVETGRPAGSAMLVRRASLEDVGTMEESYFLYWEECEWAFRFQLHGWKIGYVPDAVVFHTANHSTGGIGSKIYEYYWTRNALQLVQEVRHGSRSSVVRSLFPLLSRRLRDMAHKRAFASLSTAIAYDTLGTFDFLRGRSGYREGLPPKPLRTITRG
jgi:GT2 family glycosyltransferase